MKMPGRCGRFQPARISLLLVLFTPFAVAQAVYENHGGYAYRVEIPSGLTAVKAPPPAPAHGFAIHLDPLTASTVFVDGTYNAMLHASAREAAEANANDLGDTRIGRAKFQSAKLAGLPAVRTTLRYHDKKQTPFAAGSQSSPFAVIQQNPTASSTKSYSTPLQPTRQNNVRSSKR